MNYDQMHIILSLVFANNTAFQCLSRNQCKNILVTFFKDKEIIETNININNCIIKIKCENLYRKINKNTLSLIKADHRNSARAISFYTKKQEICIEQALSPDIAEYFKIFFIAEYKELIHVCMFDPYYDEKIDSKLLRHIEAMVFKMYTQHHIYLFKHQPTHFLLSDGHYSYYEMFETKGFNIMDVWDGCDCDYYHDDL